MFRFHFCVNTQRLKSSFVLKTRLTKKNRFGNRFIARFAVWCIEVAHNECVHAHERFDSGNVKLARTRHKLLIKIFIQLKSLQSMNEIYLGTVSRALCTYTSVKRRTKAFTIMRFVWEFFFSVVFAVVIDHSRRVCVWFVGIQVNIGSGWSEKEIPLNT